MILHMTGTAPLIMHNSQLADPDNTYALKIQKITDKKKNMTPSDRAEVARLKFLGGLYYDDEIGPYLPAENVFRSLIKAGTTTRQGGKVEMAVEFFDTRAPLEYDGPRDSGELFGDGYTVYVDRRLVGVNRVKIPAVRPIFPKWAASFEIEMDYSVLSSADFASIAERAGRVGVGDFRRFYGKYSVRLEGK